jgi:hypothetical protein
MFVVTTLVVTLFNTSENLACMTAVSCLDSTPSFQPFHLKIAMTENGEQTKNHRSKLGFVAVM